MIDHRNSLVGSFKMIVVETWDRGIIVILWLSFSPWSTPGGWDKASVDILVFPGMCLILKSYSWRSMWHRAVRLFRFCGDFQ